MNGNKVGWRTTRRVLWCLLWGARLAAAQLIVPSTVRALDGTSDAAPNHLAWQFRSTDDFESVEVTWVRTLYGESALLRTHGSKLPVGRTVIEPGLRGAADLRLVVERLAPDEKDMRELRIAVNGTIGHRSTGTFFVRVTNARGDERRRNLTVDLNVGCLARDSDPPRIRRRVCEPAGYGWLPDDATVVFRPVFAGRARRRPLRLRLSGAFDYEHREYARGCRLAAYLGPGGPLVSISAEEACEAHEVDLSWLIKSGTLWSRHLRIE